MSNLTAFKFAETVVIAAESAEQALKMLHAEPDYAMFKLEEGHPCTDAELDAPQTCTSHRAAPTLRQRLDHVTEPCFLQDWDGCCPNLPASVWATVEAD